MKKPVFVRVAILLVLAAATTAALLGDRTSAAPQANAAKPNGKTEVVALNVAKRVPLQHARCRTRAGL